MISAATYLKLKSCDNFKSFYLIISTRDGRIVVGKIYKSYCTYIPKNHIKSEICIPNLYFQEPTLYTVKGIAILDNDGNRILAKYYDKNVFPTAKEQRAFEKNLFNKTHRANAEIIMLDGLTCVYKSNVDLFFYVMGSSHENEV